MSEGRNAIICVLGAERSLGK